jgi:hypothetical protein
MQSYLYPESSRISLSQTPGSIVCRYYAVAMPLVIIKPPFHIATHQ